MSPNAHLVCSHWSIYTVIFIYHWKHVGMLSYNTRFSSGDNAWQQYCQLDRLSGKERIFQTMIHIKLRHNIVMTLTETKPGIRGYFFCNLNKEGTVIERMKSSNLIKCNFCNRASITNFSIYYIRFLQIMAGIHYKTFEIWTDFF